MRTEYVISFFSMPFYPRTNGALHFTLISQITFRPSMYCWQMLSMRPPPRLSQPEQNSQSMPHAPHSAGWTIRMRPSLVVSLMGFSYGYI